MYARGLCSKNHPLHFLYSETYGIPTFSEKMSRCKFTAFLKYLRLDYKSNRRCTGPGADRSPRTCVGFQTFACMCQWKYKRIFSLTVDKLLIVLKSRCPFIVFMPKKPDKYGVKENCCLKNRAAKYWVDGNSFFKWWTTFTLETVSPENVVDNPSSVNLRLPWKHRNVLEQGETRCMCVTCKK